MNKEVITIPKDKFPLDFFEDMKEQLQLSNSWIFFHYNVYRKLKVAYGDRRYKSNPGHVSFLDNSELDDHGFPLLDVTLTDINVLGEWHFVRLICTKGTKHFHDSKDPEKIYFFKMEE